MDKKETQKLLLILGGIVILFLVYSSSHKTPSDTTNILKSSTWDISAQVKSNNLEQYLIEEPDFDYSNPLILNVASFIKNTTSSPDQAVKMTAKYVVENIKYDVISVNYCYSEKASTVVKAGMGDCVSMSRLVTSLLRAQGIPARTMGGCLSFKSSCMPLFAAVPGLEPQKVPMTPGDFKKRGFLHEYVHVWTPDKGWFLVEATAGQVLPLTCARYINYQYDSNSMNRCTIEDSSFWNRCEVA